MDNRLLIYCSVALPMVKLLFDVDSSSLYAVARYSASFLVDAVKDL